MTIKSPAMVSQAALEDVYPCFHVEKNMWPWHTFCPSVQQLLVSLKSQGMWISASDVLIYLPLL